MSELALFAETPRAGQLGHRFLASLGLSISENEMAAFIQAATDDVTLGENFVAVGRNVPQQAVCGTFREGREVLVLAGIDVRRTPGHLLARIVEVLREQITSLDCLIRDGIDWSCVSQTEVVLQRAELAAWLAALQALCVTRVAFSEGPRPLRTVVPVSESASPSTGCGKDDRICRAALVFVQLSLLVTGLIAGFLVGVWYSDGASTTVTAGSPDDGGPPNRGDPKPAALDPGEIDPGSSDGEVKTASYAGELIRNAAEDPDARKLPQLLSLFPHDANLPHSSVEKVLDTCEQLLKTGQPYDAVRLAQQASALGAAFRHDSHQAARLADLKRKATEACAPLDQVDLRLYEDIWKSSGAQQLLAAQKYLQSGPRRSMSQAVRHWVDRAQRGVKLEIRQIALPSKGPYDIRLATDRRGVDVHVEELKGDLRADPIVLDLSHLGITMKQLPCRFDVSVTCKKTGMWPSGRPVYRGALKLDGDVTRGISVPLDAVGNASAVGRKRIEFRVMAAEALPKWTRGE